MARNLIYLIFLFLFQYSNSQEYLDLFSVNYGESVATAYENSSQTTTITSFDANLTLPIELNKKVALITGADFSSDNLQLFPDSIYNNLYLTRLKMGAVIIHSQHWSGTYILLPKLSSDYININRDDFYIGGLVILKYKKKKNLSYRFGIYASNEAFGLFVTPIIGLQYLSPNSRFEMNLFLPNDANLNYKIAEKTKIGFSYFARGQSFNLTTDNTQSTYAVNNSLELCSYIQNNSLHKNVFFRLKIGYSNNSFEVYPIDQKIDFAVAGFEFGDNRTQLNDKLSGSAFVRIQAIYRIDIPSK